MGRQLEDCVVVVTGAGSGVGRGIAAGFCQDGAQVFGIGRTEADLERTAKTLGQGRMRWIVGDVSRGADVERLFALAEGECGRVDVVVNNAAVYPKVRFLAHDMEDFERGLAINVGGVARCCRRALPGMLARGYGRVINIGSFAHADPVPEASLYSASKGAMSVLTKAVAREIDPLEYPDVLVNELVPGVYRTRMTPDEGDDPMSAYPFVKNLVTLPRGGAHGRVFLRDRLIENHHGWRARLRRVLGRVLPPR
ncbi:MAG: SDR family oxidoreductase [Polyangiaceae bacterium]|nr:SDR family oxidoreductase [Polyangiaceae bacterium]